MDNKISGNKNSAQWWKIAVFILGVLMIAGAVTYTLVTRNAVSSNAQAGNSTATQTAATSKPTSEGVGELNWVRSLDSKWGNNDFIFVLFPGNDDATGKMNQAAKTALEKIRKAGTSVELVTLISTDPEFQTTLDRLAIQKLPAVLVMAATGQGAIVKGEITETKLLDAYLTLQKTCVPGTSGCCPAK
jgi:hypothetical protein